MEDGGVGRVGVWGSFDVGLVEERCFGTNLMYSFAVWEAVWWEW